MRLFLIALALSAAGCQGPEPAPDRSLALVEAEARRAEASAREVEALARIAEAERSRPAAPSPYLADDEWGEGEPVFDGAGRRGDWFVVVGGGQRADDPAIAARQRELERAGFGSTLVDSDDFPNFNPGLAVLVIGPETEATAQVMLRDVRTVVPDAYVKPGW